MKETTSTTPDTLSQVLRLFVPMYWKSLAQVTEETPIMTKCQRYSPNDTLDVNLNTRLSNIFAAHLDCEAADKLIAISKE